MDEQILMLDPLVWDLGITKRAPSTKRMTAEMIIIMSILFLQNQKLKPQKQHSVMKMNN
jgi:hypothetical protein